MDDDEDGDGSALFLTFIFMTQFNKCLVSFKGKKVK